MRVSYDDFWLLTQADTGRNKLINHHNLALFGLSGYELIIRNWSPVNSVSFSNCRGAFILSPISSLQFISSHRIRNLKVPENKAPYRVGLVVDSIDFGHSTTCPILLRHLESWQNELWR